MASHIELWNPETLQTEDSEERYTRISRIVGLESDGWDSTHREMTVYLHDGSGLVVHDIPEFEKWLKRVEGK